MITVIIMIITMIIIMHDNDNDHDYDDDDSDVQKVSTYQGPLSRTLRRGADIGGERHGPTPDDHDHDDLMRMIII